MGLGSWVTIWPYQLTPAQLAAPAILGWRRRITPGARPFAAAFLFGLISVAGAAAESMAVDPAQPL
jgi:hypothetical protein